ncbi:hypothetical protein [Agrobacterium pusense]|uniref:hypothetical protein n=1 Tax=Agrobacterium pusense TaxID=648995 RepID=UPI001C6EDCDF|nr:hypothetical protein [Agrobacterium pusense]MBW9070622.1 hypothetical protein [Agrobacterium pusense]MBW9085731.1 hypothetical protein [Agrobacterium pusense]MBW9127246.1 hypothetical protein [Agrobacterium pusense]MBW9138299.1 hypothetical protein [Agrobacterium pusense]
MSDAYDLPGAAQTAVFNLAEEVKQRAARRLVHRLQRISVSGIYGEVYRYRSLWDEFCHEQQNGPYFDDVWDETLEGLLQAEVERLTPGEFEIVWLASVPEVEDLKTAPRVQADVRQELRTVLEALASTRDLERFEVWE